MFSKQIPIIEGLDCNAIPTDGNTVTYSSDYLNTCIFEYNNI